MSDYIVMPFHLAGRYQREHAQGYDPFTDMRPSEAIMCRRMMHARDKADALLVKWEGRDIDNSKE